MTMKNLKRSSKSGTRLYIPENIRKSKAKSNRTPINEIRSPQKQAKRKHNELDNNKFQLSSWLQMKNNSCYIDSFITICYFGLFSNFDFCKIYNICEYHNIMECLVELILSISKDEELFNEYRDLSVNIYMLITFHQTYWLTKWEK